MVELTWEGKYDADGRRTAPLRLQLPFQTVETVNESAQERQMALALFSAGRPPEWRNRLIWGSIRLYEHRRWDTIGVGHPEA